MIRKFAFSIGGNPIYFRTGTSDGEVFNDMLVREEYDCTGEAVRDPRFIVDCGAYAGYSTLFFLERYKNAHVLAIEPDPGNFELCRLNLEPYSSRVTLLNAAVWSRASDLVLHPGELADGRDWATMVQAPKKGETPNVRGIDLGSLLRDSGFSEIDLLKMNIECSEREVFSTNLDTWLPHVKNMIVQLHDEQADDAFFGAMRDYGFLMARPPTLIVCTEIAPKAPAMPRTSGPSRSENNPIANGDFEEYRVEPGRIVPGNWLAGSTDIASQWQIIVCDPQFSVSLAVRTGRQLAGENALLVRVRNNQPIMAGSAPYAAIENKSELRPRPGERWKISAAVKSTGVDAPGRVRGAYLFLRLYYDDGSFSDLRTEPLMETSDSYAEKGGLVDIPPSPSGLSLERATVWLYAWLANPGEESATTAYAPWEVLFDDVVCTKS